MKLVAYIPVQQHNDVYWRVIQSEDLSVQGQYSFPTTDLCNSADLDQIPLYTWYD